MKKIMPLAGILLSFGAHAQILQSSECPTPGALLSKTYTGQSGETTSTSFSRSGSNTIPTTAQTSGNLKARIFSNYTEQRCVTQTQHYTERVCTEVHADIALGRGNNNLFDLYNLSIAPARRAQIFSQTLRYNQSAPQGARLTLASEIVRHLTRIASVAGVPRSWDAFVKTLQTIVAEGFLTQADYDQIVGGTLHGPYNRTQLGLTPVQGLVRTEGRGNGKLQSLFDLSATQLHRASRIRTTIEGVTPDTSKVLANTFISYASVNGIPSTWDHFLHLFNYAAQTNAITPLEHFQVTQEFELINRERLGFELRFDSCQNVSRTHYYNKVVANGVKEFHSEVQKSFSINLTNAPLLAGERESHTVYFNSMSGLELSLDRDYNNYSVKESEVNNSAVYELVGTRKKVTPPMTVNGKISRSGKTVNIALQNTNFNPLVGGKVVVEAAFYEKVVILKDKLLTTKTFELNDGALTSFLPKVQMNKKNRKSYVILKMKVVGSPYYNEQFSNTLEIKE